MEILNKIINDYHNGKSLTKIAKDENLSRRKVTKLLKDAGETIINKHNEIKFNQQYFDLIDTEEKAYWLGFIFADGCIMTNNYTFELSLGKQDEDHIKKFVSDVQFTGKIYNKKYATSCSLRSKYFWTQLNSLGCIPKKSLVLEFPDISVFSNKDLIRHFIRGYFDGDGCISQHVYTKVVSPYVELIGTKSFINKIIEYSGINGTMYHDKRHHDNTFSLRFSKNSGIDFINYLYDNCNIYLNRKYSKYTFFKNGSRSVQEWTEFNQPKSVKAWDGNTEVNTETKESVSPYSVEIEPDKSE